MRALVLEGHGLPEALQIGFVPRPSAGLGEVSVRVRAAGLNFADVMARRGFYPDAPPPPCVLGYEFAGDVASVGSDVSDIAVGDPVFGVSRFGAQAETVVVPRSSVLSLPDGWSYEEGAAFPVVYATAYAALVHYGVLGAGERVLIQAAAGGVGRAAVQIAALRGAEIFGTASTLKQDALREMGVTHPIDYQTEDFVAEVQRITGEDRPLDVVLDGIGGESLTRGYRLLRAGGRLIVSGTSSLVSSPDQRTATREVLAKTPRFHAGRLLANSTSVIGINILHLWSGSTPFDVQITPLLAEFVENGLRPNLWKSFALTDAAKAHAALESRESAGKIVLTID